MRTQSSRKHPALRASETNRAASLGRHNEKGTSTLRTRLHGRFYVGGLALLGSIILFNALALQKERHPSPLFQTIATGAAKPAQTVASLAPTRQEQASLAHIAKQSSELTMPVTAAPNTPSTATITRQSQPLPQGTNKDALTERIVNAEKQRPSVGTTLDADSALVTELQYELHKRGHYKGEIDGKSGPRMAQAIRSFQFSQRVAVDGKVSEALLRDVKKAKIPAMKEELLDLLQKNTPPPPSSTSQRAQNKTG